MSVYALSVLFLAVNYEAFMNDYVTESEKRRHRVCFTGHRPWKIPIPESSLRIATSNAVADAISHGYTTFISGMAQGFDIVAAETVLEYRKRNPSIRLICALPFPDYNLNWDYHWKSRCKQVLLQADLTRTISPSYTPNCYQLRNQWMVRHSSLVIAMYLCAPSGTKNTIDYAESLGVPVERLHIVENTK